jgi:hypothetical protein
LSPESFAALVILGIVAAFIWFAIGRNTLFEVAIEEGKARLKRGKVTDAFLADIQAVTDEFGVRKGWVGGVPMRGRRVRLVFGGGVPPRMRQRLRNIWLNHQ